MSRKPGYETTSYVGSDYEDRRETMAGARGADIGRPRNWRSLAAARRGGRGQDDGQLTVQQMRARLAELGAR